MEVTIEQQRDLQSKILAIIVKHIPQIRGQASAVITANEITTTVIQEVATWKRRRKKRKKDGT